MAIKSYYESEEALDIDYNKEMTDLEDRYKKGSIDGKIYLRLKDELVISKMNAQIKPMEESKFGTWLKERQCFKSFTNSDLAVFCKTTPVFIKKVINSEVEIPSKWSNRLKLYFKLDEKEMEELNEIIKIHNQKFYKQRNEANRNRRKSIL